MKFSNYNLKPYIYDGLRAIEFYETTEIQSIVIPKLIFAESKIADNEIYNTPDVKDNYGKDLIIKDKDFSVYNGDLQLIDGVDNLEQALLNRYSTLIGARIRLEVYGIQASIGDALVQLGQKDLLIDCQGNWGNILTGDGAAAPRYIEARLSKFALDTVFNPKTTHWMLSYDGRKKEPIHLPIKFPLLLTQGVEGIAVGLNSKILPHNFNEICDAALAYLKGETFQLYPDFPTGGVIDVTRYNDGERGGQVKIRARIQKADDNKTLIITEIPYGTTTTKIIETILKANAKGKIKIRKVDDFTADTARIVVQLAPGTSSDKAIDALYAFTDCEVNISPNCCVVEDKKPIFTSVSNLLRLSTDRTKALLKWELEIEKSELEEKYFYTSLERIFIENRIYKQEGYENAPNKEKLILFVDEALAPWKDKLIREVRTEDIERLFEIKMIRITKFDSKKADELMKELDRKIKACIKNLKNLTALLNGFQNRVGVSTRAVEVCLIAAIQLDTERLNALEELFLKVLCVVFVAAPRVGNINVGGADIFVVVAAYNRLHVCRNFAATVVFVPREEELCLFAKLLEGANDHQGRSNVTEVTNVNRARGTNARGANVFFLFGVARNNSLRNFF